MTHYDYLEQYLLTHVSYSKQTIKAYRSDLRQMKMNHVEWSLKSLQTYFDLLIQQYKPATAMRRYHALTALGHELVRAKRLKSNPMKQVRPIVHQHIQQREYHPLEETIQTILKSIIQRTVSSLNSSVKRASASWRPVCCRSKIFSWMA